VPFFLGELGPHLTQCRLAWAEAYLCTKWHLNHPTVVHNTPTLQTDRQTGQTTVPQHRAKTVRPKTTPAAGRALQLRRRRVFCRRRSLSAVCGRLTTTTSRCREAVPAATHGTGGDADLETCRREIHTSFCVQTARPDCVWSSAASSAR